jgi:two-component system, OmpR family, phosphate regulon response regulator PhoB
MSAQILVVEDELGIQELIAVNLSRAGHTVTCVGDAEAAQVHLHSTLPDLVLMDWMLPGMSGVDMTRRMRSDARMRAVPVIMLTARDEERDKITGLECGADDYITKPFSPREMLARVSAVLRRKAPVAIQEATDLGGLRLDPALQKLSIAGVPVTIGPTEFRLLHFMASRPERVYSRQQLLTQVWGDGYEGDERTVDVYVRRIRALLEPTGHDPLIKTIRGCGYAFSLASDE